MHTGRSAGAPNAQDTLRINFDPEYHLLDEGSYGFMKLIANQSNQIQYEENNYEIRYPKNFFVQDTAIAFNYFTGWEDAAIDGSIAFLFGNYATKLPFVYVDDNHNLDLTTFLYMINL